MNKTVTLDWHAWADGKVVVAKNSAGLKAAAAVASTVHLSLMPATVFAASGGADTWNNVFQTVLNMADWLCVGIITFSGVTWMFGNRTKALEFIMGGSIGYIIIRHAVDIRNWLKTL